MDTPGPTHSLEDQPTHRSVPLQSILTEDQIRPLIEEELRKIDDAKPSKLWIFLNSSFGMFVLSSVLVSGVTALYTIQRRKASENHLRYVETLKYSTEFAYRLSEMEICRDALSKAHGDTGPSQGPTIALIRIVRGEEGTLEGAVKFLPSLPEFTNVNLLAIVMRLRILGIIDQTEDVSKVLLAIERRGYDDYQIDIKTLDQHLAVLREFRDNSLKQGLSKWE
jgi:hypothetical protein